MTESAAPYTPQSGDDAESAQSERKARTQARILEVAMKLFATRGYQRTSISQIASRSGVSRASIFWHFGDKEGLFEETCRHFLIPFRKSLEESGRCDDARTRILAQIRAYDAFITAQREVIHAFVGWVFTSEPHARFLGQELQLLHRAFHLRLQEDLRELVGNDESVPVTVSSIVTLLHGNMLMNLIGFPPDHPMPRGEMIVKHVEMILPRAEAGED